MQDYAQLLVPTDFYPRPPRGGRQTIASFRRNVLDFYPRPPRGGRRPFRRKSSPATQISIHALREEGDLVVMICSELALVISIHALREEGDQLC